MEQKFNSLFHPDSIICHPNFLLKITPDGTLKEDINDRFVFASAFYYFHTGEYPSMIFLSCKKSNSTLKPTKKLLYKKFRTKFNRVRYIH